MCQTLMLYTLETVITREKDPEKMDAIYNKARHDVIKTSTKKTCTELFSR